MITVHRCKLHDHPYTVCPLCSCQYCPRYWTSGCPRASWHPAHGTDPMNTGRRYTALELARQQSARNRAQGEGEI